MNATFDGPLTLRDAVVRQLRDEIVNGVLRPGTVIKDAELAARLGFSITPVREALSQLAMEGLIEMPPNRTKRVAPLNKQSALELGEVVRLLSVPAFERGLARLTEEDLQAMRTAHNNMIGAIERDDRRAASLAGRTFADIVIRAAGNQELRRILSTVLTRTERLVLIRYQESFAQTTIEMHGRILSALERGDHETAAAAYREQLDCFHNIIETYPDDVWN